MARGQRFRWPSRGKGLRRLLRDQGRERGFSIVPVVATHKKFRLMEFFSHCPGFGDICEDLWRFLGHFWRFVYFFGDFEGFGDIFGTFLDFWINA